MKQPTSSKSFCILPWIHINSSVSGTYRTCCNSLNSFNFTEKDVSIDDAFNSNEMNQVRKFMVEGKEHPACSVCYDRERNGGLSFRQTYNNEKFTSFIDSSSDETIRYLDIRFDNNCNLACRMCDPGSSNKITKTIEWYKDNNLSLPNHWSSFKNPKRIHDYNQLRKDYIIKNADKIKVLKVSGGEPFFNKSFLEVINFLVEQGYSNDIKLLVTTNGTKFTRKILNNLSHFKVVHITISIDGIENTYEYIRYPFTWNKWVERFEDLLNYIEYNKIENIYINTATLISAYNWTNVYKLYNFLVNYIDKYSFLQKIHFKPRIDFNLDLRPVDSELSAKWLSDEILDYGLYKWCLTDNRQMTEFTNFVNKAKTIDPELKLKKQKDLKYITDTLDIERHQTFYDLDPAFSNFLEKLNEKN